MKGTEETDPFPQNSWATSRLRAMERRRERAEVKRAGLADERRGRHEATPPLARNWLLPAESVPMAARASAADL